MKAGDTFLVPDFFGKHLNVVIALLEDGSIIHCHLTTQNRRSDNTCVVESGEHEFVKHGTVVRYDAVQHCSGDALAALERCIVKRFAPVSAELLARIRQGALDSPQTPDYIKALLTPGRA